MIDEFTPSEAVYGTLAFEDQWPKMGDYDFNDFVMNYSYELEKGDNNMITALKLTFTPIAKGAASWTHIGVGIELPLSADNIDEAKSEGATLEEGNDRATFIVWNDVNTAFGTTEGYVNTEGAAVGVSAIPVEVTVRLKTPVSSLLTQKFNPFIFVNSRQREIHLVDYKPTLHSSGQKMTDRILRLKFIIVWITDIHGLLISRGRKTLHRRGIIPRKELSLRKHILIMRNGCLINPIFPGLTRVCRGT